MMNKLKGHCNKVLNIFNKLTVFVDIGLCLGLLDYLSNIEDRQTMETLLYYGVIVLIFVLCYRYIRAIVYLIKSSMDREVYLLSNRVVAITGKQRVGKSSISLYFAKYAKKVYSNVPFCLKNKYTNKLTTDILTLKTKIDDNSLLVVDEANLFYNNTMSHEERTLFGQALLCQCVGHFFDGNILYVSTDILRMPKIIRQEWSTKLQVIRSRSYRYSYVGDSILKFLYFLVNKETLKFTGIRMWECQQYEQIQDEQYISLLGKKEDENMFAPFYIFADWQGIGSVEYDDRYMSAYYQDRPDNIDVAWDSLQISREDFEVLYDGLLSRYIKDLDNKDPKTRIKG